MSTPPAPGPSGPVRETPAATPRPTTWLRTASGATGPSSLVRWHRIAAVGFGLVLCAFGILGLLRRLELFSTHGSSIMGLSSNGLLSVISLVSGGLLIAAGLRGGRIASTALVVFGAAFMLSGLANVLVLTTALNVLAFTMSNVIFSLVAGATLLILGTWGRFTGRLPTDNPYQRERHPGEDVDAGGDDPGGQGNLADRLPTTYSDAIDISDVSDLAEAERAVARGGATPKQRSGVATAAQTPRSEDRLAGWRDRARLGDRPGRNGPAR